MRPEIPLRDITTQQIWTDLQTLQNEFLNHNHLKTGAQILSGAVNGILQSPNFVASSSGWQILPNGSVEFNDGTFRGSLIAGELHIPDQDTTASSFHANSIGDTWWGATETDFNTDPTNAVAYILSTGEAKFTNILLSGPNVLIQTATSGQRVEIDGTNNRIALYKTASISSFVAGADFSNTVSLYNVYNDEDNKRALWIDHGGTGTSGTDIGVMQIALTNGSIDLPALKIDHSGIGPHLRMNSLAADPSNNSALIGDMAVVSGVLKLCTIAGSPGTYSAVIQANNANWIDLTDSGVSILHSHAIATHASTHENGGSDEISVADLSGELADRQKSKDYNDLRFPDNLRGGLTIIATSGGYTVPAGKRLYILGATVIGAAIADNIIANSLKFFEASGATTGVLRFPNPIILQTGTSIGGTNWGRINSVYGILLSTFDSDIIPVQNNVSSPYTVPANKEFILLRSWHDGSSSAYDLKIDGAKITDEVSFGKGNADVRAFPDMPLVFDTGTVISATGTVNIFGYTRPNS